MKFLLFLGVALLISGNHAGADSSVFRPVMNDAVFLGDFVTFGEAKPTFRPVHREQPVYPDELLARRIEGFAVVAFLVELDGSTSQCQVVKASDIAFGEAARSAIAQWRFSPPEFAGKRGPIAMRLPVDFTLAPEPADSARDAASAKTVAAR